MSDAGDAEAEERERTERLRRSLDEELTTTIERAAALEVELTSIIEASEAANIDDEHDPEGATIAYERALVISLRDTALTTIARLRSAAERLDAGTYGRCDRCGATIPTDRLLARPTTDRCVSCAGARGDGHGDPRSRP